MREPISHPQVQDPVQTGVDRYWDRPPDRRPRGGRGELAMFTRRLDLDGLLREATHPVAADATGAGPRDLG